ncbi:MAG: STAS domain-containing protein [Kistimonas sp.]|nr:STAS domain-containing protein [Kistimonas sp.]
MIALEPVKPGYLALRGTVDAGTVPALLESGWNKLKRCLEEGDVVVDLSAVSDADSAALALLVCWLRRARRDQGHRLCYVQFPGELAALAGLCGLDVLLCIDSDAGAGSKSSSFSAAACEGNTDHVGK